MEHRMEHRPYLHEEVGESSLRCTCGHWQGTSPVDVEGHAEHVLVARPAYRAMARVLAAWTGAAQRLVFTRRTEDGLERAEDEFAAEGELLTDLLAAVESYLVADHYEAAADYLTEAGPQNGERPWPFAHLLRDKAEQIRATAEAIHAGGVR